jgi:hypothetical protein
MLIESKGVASGMVGILTDEEELKEDWKWSGKASVKNCSSMIINDG